MRGGSGLAWPRGTALDLEVEERKRLDGPLKGWLDHMAASSRGRSVASFSAGLFVDAQESGSATTATDDVNMMFCAHSSAYFTRSRCEQSQHVPMSAALDAPASWLVRRPSLLRCCSLQLGCLASGVSRWLGALAGSRLAVADEVPALLDRRFRLALIR